MLATVLSAEYGIGVRNGAFCTHIATRPLIARTGLSSTDTLRVSIGLGTAHEHIERLIRTLRTLTTSGPNWRYERVDGAWAPTADGRARPKLA